MSESKKINNSTEFTNLVSQEDRPAQWVPEGLGLPVMDDELLSM